MLSIRKFAPLLALVSLMLCHSSYGAAQLASGAKTSAQPTSTNPQIRSCQITFDPGVPLYSLTSFKLSVQYDAQFLTVNDIQFIDPFVQTNAVGTISNFDVAPTITIDSVAGLISGIAGHTSDVSRPGEDVNIFLVDFTLKSDVPLDTVLTFTIFADGPKGDFVAGTDPLTGDVLVTGAAPTTIQFAYNDPADFVVLGAPLPSTAVAGIAILGLAFGWHFIRRRNVVCA
jgi:hypothetical protein